MRKPHNFDEKVEKAKKWELRLTDSIVDFLIKQNIRRVNYDTPENIETQKKGIDYIVNSKRGDWEAKIRGTPHYYNQDILLETVSVRKYDIPGWAYTSEADAIAYCWLNKSKTNLMRRGYIILIKKLRETEWFKRIQDNYDIQNTKSERKGEIWWTEFVCPPISDFPKGTLYPFNPTLPSENIQQPTLDSLIIKKEMRTQLSDFMTRKPRGW